MHTVSSVSINTITVFSSHVDTIAGKEDPLSIAHESRSTGTVIVVSISV